MPRGEPEGPEIPMPEMAEHDRLVRCPRRVEDVFGWGWEPDPHRTPAWTSEELDSDSRVGDSAGAEEPEPESLDSECDGIECDEDA